MCRLELLAIWSADLTLITRYAQCPYDKEGDIWHAVAK